MSTRKRSRLESYEDVEETASNLDSNAFALLRMALEAHAAGKTLKAKEIREVFSVKRRTFEQLLALSREKAQERGWDLEVLPEVDGRRSAEKQYALVSYMPKEPQWILASHAPRSHAIYVGIVTLIVTFLVLAGAESQWRMEREMLYHYLKGSQYFSLEALDQIHELVERMVQEQYLITYKISSGDAESYEIWYGIGPQTVLTISREAIRGHIIRFTWPQNHDKAEFATQNHSDLQYLDDLLSRSPLRCYGRRYEASRDSGDPSHA